MPDKNSAAQAEWVQLQSDLNDQRKIDQSKANKFSQKFKENPFVPLGLLATTGCLCYGLLSFRRGNMQQSQYAMRARVVAQGATVAAILIGIAMSIGKIQKSPETPPNN